METHTAIFKGRVNSYYWRYYCNMRELSELMDDYERHLRWKEESRARRTKDLISRFEVTYEIELKESRDVEYHEEIWRGEITRPTLEVGEEIWINDLELLVRVDRCYRTTSGEMIYEVNHVIKTIHNESTEESRIYAIDEWFKDVYPNLKTFDELKMEFIKEPEPKEYSLKVEEKSKEKTWFGWLNFFKKD